MGVVAKLNATVGVAFAMENDCGTSGAGAQVVASPGCDAVIVQLPAPVICSVAIEVLLESTDAPTVQTLAGLAAKLTSRLVGLALASTEVAERTMSGSP